MSYFSLHDRLRGALCVLAYLFVAFQPLQATEETDSDYPLGPIGGEFRIHTAKKYIRVTRVTAGAPGAAAGLRVSDFLTGVNGVPFSTTGGDFQGVVRELGAAIEYAESTTGALPLNVLRAGVGNVTVNVLLPVLGSQSPATPLNSPKWDAVYERACLDINHAFIASSSGDLGYPGGWGALALLTHPNWNDTTGAKPFRLGVNKYRDYIVGRLNAAQYAPVEDTLYDKSVNPNANGATALYLESWFLGQGVMFLSEYVAKTQEPVYIGLLQIYAEKMANRIQWWRQPNGTVDGWHQPLEVGMIGHGNVSGDYMHYNFGGGINVVGIHVVGGLAMAKKAGVNMNVAPIDGRYFGFDPATLPGNLPAGMTPRVNGTGAALSVVPAGFENRQPTLDEKLQFGWKFFKRSQDTGTGHVNYSVGTGSYWDSGARTPGALFTGLNLGAAPATEDTERINLMKSYLVNDHDIRLNAHAFTAASPCFTSLVLPALGARERSFIQDNWRFYYTLMREPNGSLRYMAGRDKSDGGSQSLLAAAFTAMQHGVAKGGLLLVNGYPTANQRLVDFSKVPTLAWNKLSARSLRTGMSGSITLDLGVTDGAGLPTADYSAAWSTVSGSATFTAPTSVDTSIQAAYPGVHTVRLTVTSGSITTTEDIEIQMPQAPIAGYAMGEADYRIYSGISGTAVSALTNAPAYPASPSMVSTLTELAGLHSGDDFGATISGVVIPRETGSYRFYIASDDASQLWFNSSGATAAGATKIAEMTTYTTPRNWTATPAQASAIFTLTAGQPYYLQARHKEGTGGEHVSIGWTTPSSSTIQVIDSGSIARPVTLESPAILTQPLNVTTTLGSSIDLGFTVSGPEPRFFQWKKDGANYGPPTSSPALTISNAASGHAGSWQCFYTNGDNVLTTHAVTVSFSDAGILTMGGLWQDFYAGISGDSIADLTNLPNYPLYPDSSGPISQPTTGDQGDEYGQRWSGWIIPTASGNYRFYASADDATQLHLSPDAYESHKRLIHSITSYTDVRQWSARAPSAWIALVAGQRYFVEFLHKEGGGGDHAAFTWQKEGDPVPTNGASLIPSANLQYTTGGTRPDATTAPPLAVADSFGQIVSGSTLTLSPLLNDADAALATVTISAITQPASGTLTILPGTRTLSFTADASGIHTASYTITNAIGLTATASITLAVVENTTYQQLGGWWRMNEGSGTATADSSGAGRIGTLVSSPIWTSGKLNGGLNFSGSNYLAIPGSATPTTLTISAWIKPTAVTGIQSILSQQGAFSLRTRDSRIRFTTMGILDYDSPSGLLTANVWQHVALTFTPNTAGGLQLYVNGVLRHTASTTGINTNSNPWQIGRQNTSEYFTGTLDEILLHTRILNLTEITAIMNATPFDDWRADHYSLTELAIRNTSGPLADTDFDSIENLMEYALGLNPNGSETLSTKVTRDIESIGPDQFLRLNITRNPKATDLIYTVEVSSHLQAWNTSQTVIESNTATSLIVRDSIPMSANTHRFIRLRVAK